MKVVFTHKAWAMLCPVYATDPDDENLSAMMSRHWALEPWMTLNTFLFDSAAVVAGWLGFSGEADMCHSYEKLDEPIEIDATEE